MEDNEKLTPLALANRAMDALRSLHSDTPDAELLLQWPGWGALAPAFEATPSGSWLAIADELETTLDADALDAARSTLDTSFYTPALLTEAVHQLLAATGFTGGRVLEPGCGSGRFMHATPLGSDIEWTGVEIDPTAAAMAAIVNPDAQIIAEPLQKVMFPTGSFDAVVGNIPFSSGYIFDPVFPASSLHAYFLKRSIDAVREGGYVIAITSRFTMDAASGLLGSVSAESGGELIAALRLPTGAFATEGTDVVTDVLLIRKRVAGETLNGWDDRSENMSAQGSFVSARTQVTEPAIAGQSVSPVTVNAYWGKHPEHVAGRMALTTFFKNPLVVLSDNPAADIRSAVTAVASALIPQSAGRPSELAPVVLHDHAGRKEGSFHVVDGVIQQVTGGTLAPLRNSAELRKLVELRDHATQLLALEADTSLPGSAIDSTRAATLEMYRSYVQKFGALNRGTLVEGKADPETGEPTLSWRRPSLGGFRRDPDYVTVMALEYFDQNDGVATPAPILLGRVNHAPKPVESVGSAAEALAVCRGEGRGVDLERIASLLGLADTDAATEALAGLVFQEHGVLIPAADYLSGNVRVKLATARDNGWEANVAALEKVLPAELTALDITVSLGAPYVTESDIQAFGREVLGGGSVVRYTPAVAVWEVSQANTTFNAAIEFGTRRVAPWQVLEAALNGKTITVYDEPWGGPKVRNLPETVAVAEKMSALNDRFSTWVWEDMERATRVAAEYNARFNAYVTRTLDGSYLSFPGLSEDVTPWAHQRNAVDMVVSNERVLVGHAVGAGKTKSMILSAMTLRRFGLAQKPLIIVPNHLLDQIVRETQQAYPTGRFLIASKDDLTKENRRLFAARCMTGEWDAVVMTHSAFTTLAVAPEVEELWIQQERAHLRSALMTADQHGKAKGPKAIARALRALENRIAALRADHRTDENQVLFDHLGVDYIMVDEAHLFRRLGTGSSARGNGFGGGSSKRATDLLIKVESLAQRHPGKPVLAMFTGTPWANTLAETWVWQRYLQPEALESAGVKMFDAWVATFVTYENAVEVAPDGSGFRMQTRPVGMKNIPELKAMLGQVADIVSADSINLQRPEHTIHNVVAAPTPSQLEFVKDLAGRAELTRTRGQQAMRPDGKGVDNMLLICNDGRKVALDPQLVGIDEKSAKLGKAATRIATTFYENRDRIYGASTTAGALQLVLLDMGTPHPGDSSVYGRLKGLLVQAGVPAAQVRFVHEATTDRARAAMFAQAREGAISVLIGSTSKVGTGTNIQTRLAALHHIDPPWTPAEVEQREGRGLRPGNLNSHIDIFRYVTEQTFDAYMWQALERKARAFAALYDPTATDREVADISTVVLSFGEVKALAAGNPLLLTRSKLASDVQRLRLLRSVHNQSVSRAAQQSDELKRRAAAQTRSAELNMQARDIVATRPPVGFEVGALERSFAADWRGLSVRYRKAGSTNKRSAHVEVSLRYEVVFTADVPAKVTRRGELAVAEFIAEQLNGWAGSLEATIERQWRFTAELEADAAEAAAAAAGSVFAQADVLDASVQDLARIDAEIEGQAMGENNRELSAA